MIPYVYSKFYNYFPRAKVVIQKEKTPQNMQKENIDAEEIKVYYEAS